MKAYLCLLMMEKVAGLSVSVKVSARYEISEWFLLLILVHTALDLHELW